LVEEWLEECWSPQQIALRLREEFPDDPMMWVSHETIYQSIFVQGRGALRRELYRCLRSGHCERRQRGPIHRGSRVTDMVSITERPAEAEDRSVPGHWEGDLLMGKANRSAVGVLVERASRYVMLFRLDHGHTATEVREALTATITRLPAHLWASLTWDQGMEMAHHRQFTIDTGIQVYFCDPQSPWQRATAENTNGLLRQWMPKGTDLSIHSQEDLDRMAYRLNNRPRQSLAIMKPSEKLTKLIAMTG
jgi:IS30 family transposase